MSLLAHANADFLAGVHHKDDVYALALFLDDPGSPENFVSGDECSACKGGIMLTNYRVQTNSDGKASMHFSDIHLDGVSLRYRYALLFNASKDNRTISRIDIGRVTGVEFGVASIFMPEDGLVVFGGEQ